MSAEIQFNWQMTVTNGGVASQKTPSQQSITQNAQGRAGNVYTVPTTSAGTALGIGNLGNLGVAWFTNLDPTNYFEIGVQVAGTFYPVVRILPGESFPFRFCPTGSTIYVRAHTATVKIDYEINEA